MDLQAIVTAALAEDIRGGDVTTNSCVDADADGAAVIRAKQEVVVSGHRAASEVFTQMGVRYTAVVQDGHKATEGIIIARAEGPLRGLLTGERLALNFLMHLSGIATHTAQTVRAAGSLKVVDTRKTTPLLRELEKAAVAHGGGHNHRFGLYDAVLIKDNHIAAAGGLKRAVSRTRTEAPELRIQVEVETLEQLQSAIEAGVDEVLLDNMDNQTLARAVELSAGRVLLEASGNMTAERIATLKGLGLDRVSMGGLIHQSRWVDLSMKMA